MKIGLAQLNFHIGNFPENARAIESEIWNGKKNKADLLLFSELAICGYPPLDLLEHREFIEECYAAVLKLADICTDIGVIIGAPSLNEHPTGKKLYNSAYFLYDGKIQQVFHKTLLPTYDIFDEYRHFQSNSDFRLLDFRGVKMAITICEDLWFDQPFENEFSNSRLYTINPLEKLAALKPDLIINIAASPFSFTKTEAKKSIFTNVSKNWHLPCIYLNQYGGQTELIFEGGSLIINSGGEIVKELKYFAKDSCFIDTGELINGKLNPVINAPADPIGMVHNALVLGIKDYFGKTGLSDAVLGLSGGIDSAITAVLAVQALGPGHVHALMMPSEYSSGHSVTDSVRLAHKLGINYNIISIQEIFDKYRESLRPVFFNLPEDITEENIQSRIRSIFLMAISNKFGYILLNTSNKSEASVGYGTLYGDMAGGLSVLGDVYKTDVYKLAAYINRDEEVIPDGIITKPPSAELKPGQLDIDSLPDYNILDKILYEYIEHKKSVSEISETGIDEDLVRKVLEMINHNEFKRYQTPPILRISSKAFGAGRRMPLVAKY
jgi:NAD+ synthase (glutamine-hydrolysing)